MLVIPYRRFGTTYQSDLQGSRNQIFFSRPVLYMVRRRGFCRVVNRLLLTFDFWNLEDGTDRLSQNVGKELPQYAAQYP
jgi:hypothetical protein